MTKSTWISPNDLEIIELFTPEEVRARRGDIELIEDGPFEDFDLLATDYSHGFTLYYVEGAPAGLIRRDFFKNSVEIHGHIRPEFEDRGIAHYAVLDCLEKSFRAYPKVFIQIDPSNKALKGFALRWGFKFAYQTPDGLLDYELTKEDFYKNGK